MHFYEDVGLIIFILNYKDNYYYRVFHLSVASQDRSKNEQWFYAYVKIYKLIRIFHILVICQKSDIVNYIQLFNSI